MATIQKTKQHIRESLKDTYPEAEAGGIAQLVLEHVLQKSRLQLSLSQQDEVSLMHQEQVESAIIRLQQHEPVQYVLGIAHFYGLELQVNEHVLIPRPETEELVDLVIKEHKGQQHLRVMDVCAGSGCIPLALAANLQPKTVYGLEISEGALQVAKTNADKYNLTVEWLQQDVFEPVQNIAAGSLDIITSNPPYVLEEEKELMRENVLQYEPHLALFVPDKDPIKYYIRIANLGLELLKENGRLYFEINERYGADVKSYLVQIGCTQVNIIKDMFGKDRIIAAKR